MSVRIVAQFTILTALLALAWAITVAQEPPSPFVSIENEFIRITVNRGPNEAGRFSIRTTGGDPGRPSSKDKHLIFGDRAPWTSYTTVLIDGKPYAFGGASDRRAGQSALYGEVVGEPVVKDDKILCTTKFGEIAVTQELTFVRGLSTRMLDTAGITYRIENNDTVAHQVGMRVMLDTMCGANDGAPIRAGSLAISAATRAQGTEIPDYWQAFDDLSNPTVISQGTLRGGRTTPPDQVVFADWGTLADEPWIPELAPDQSFIRKGEVDPDTAAAQVWNPITLEPGKSLVLVTYYGLGEMTVKAGHLTLGITAPAETTFEHERTQSFDITGYLQNKSRDEAGNIVEARDVTLSLVLPDSLMLWDKQNNTPADPKQFRFAALAPDDTVQASWTVKPTGKKGGAVNLLLKAESANVEGNSISHALQVNVPEPHVHLFPNSTTVPLVTSRRPTIIPMQVNMAPAEQLYGMRFVIKYDPAVVQPFDVSRGRAFVDQGRLLADWEYDDSQVGVLVVTGKRTGAVPITQAEANLATIKFFTVQPGKTAITLADVVLIDEQGQERPVGASAGSVDVLTETK
jgi:hypothetical protein